MGGKDDEETFGARRCAHAAGLDVVRMRPKPKQGKSAPDLAGTYYKFTLKTMPFDVLLPDPDAAPAANISNREPFVLMHMPKRGGQTQVAVPEPTTAVHDARTPVDAPSVASLGAPSEVTPDECSDEVTGLIERLSLPEAASNSDRAAQGAGGAQDNAQARTTLAMADSCAYCGKEGVPLKRCSICKQTWYCGAACQKKGWKRHKKVTQTPQPSTQRPQPSTINPQPSILNPEP